MAKMGRPKIENPKNIKLSTRIDAENAKLLQEYCERNNISKGAAIIQGLQLLFENERR